jgi:hypothetical protein
VPTPPNVDGYTFAGWDKEITPATENKEYIALYTPITTSEPTNKPDPKLAIADVNGDGVIDKADSVRLLQHIHFGSHFSISATGDINGDGVVNSDDVLYLNNYLKSPAQYPIAG